ncbi:unnamed protein product [Macrosiphum euphorbiae]|uniref:Uncharacterized protein n=1 Tax=Macrosiphum euphorbiae TaxID=13131 RepID=A0AAV0WJV5_9HEMI|nr:unnamed protein product [Macrosiphum euphorbiae]
MSSISELTLTDQISGQPDLYSPSLSVVKPLPGSLPTNIRSSSSGKSISNRSTPTPTQDFPPVEQNIKPPPPLITSTSGW